MSVRQYIGARYVPRFSNVNNGNWSNIYSYEPLTIVKNGNDYYTSKKSVPVGIAITNTEYWVKTGDYNGAIATLDRKIDAVDDKIDDLTDEVNGLHNLNMFKGHILFIGDSYITTLATSWADYVGTWLGKVKNTSYFISAKGGTGFAAIADGKNFTSLVNDAVVDDPEKITCVIIQGGANDIYAANRPNIIDGIANTVANIRQRFVNASVIIGECEGWIDSNYDAYARDELYNHYQQGAAKNGAYFIGATGTGLKLFPATCLQEDLKHPSAKGMIDIATRTMTAILGGSTISIPLSSGNGTYYFKENGNDVISGYFIGNYNYAPNPVITNFVCNGGAVINVPLTNHNLRATNYTVETNAYVQLRTPDNHYYMVDCTVIPSASGLMLYPRAMNANNTNFLTIDIGQVTIPRIRFDVIGHCIG